MIATPLYNGTISLEFDEKRHVYSVDGVNIPSTTTVLGVLNKPAILYWAVGQAVDYALKHIADIQSGTLKSEDINLSTIQAESRLAHEKISGEARDIGSAVHESIRLYLTGIYPSFTDESVASGYKAFLDWYGKFTVRRSEFMLYSNKHKYAGTADLLGLMRRKLLLVDFKTFNDDNCDPKKFEKIMKNLPYQEHILQLAAYKYAHEEESGEKIRECHVLYLGKKRGTFLDCEVKVGKSEQKAFLSTLNVFNWQKGKK